MPSQAETVAARVAALLLNATAAGDRVFRDRQDAFTREESPSILVELISDDAQPHGGGGGIGGPGRGTDQAECRIAVIYLTRGTTWQTVIDGMRVQGHELLMWDPTLASLLAGLHRTRAEWHAASADLPLGYCAQQYSGKYLSPTGSLSR